eukprot:3676450-Prorocentrum_lima.AAC.1
MAELDADLLQDLRRLGKPPSFHGSDPQYPDFKFGLKTYMQLVSSVAADFFTAAEGAGERVIERARVDAVGEERRKFNRQLYYALALT